MYSSLSFGKGFGLSLKQLQNILYKVHLKQVQGSTDKTIAGIAIDSRQVKNDFVFVPIVSVLTMKLMPLHFVHVNLIGMLVPFVYLISGLTMLVLPPLKLFLLLFLLRLRRLFIFDVCLFVIINYKKT